MPTPNTNPSGPNQPLNQHPLPSYTGYPVLGVNSKQFQLAQNSVQLLREPPPEGVVQSVLSVDFTPGIYVNSAGVADYAIFLQDTQGRRYILSSGSLPQVQFSFSPCYWHPAMQWVGLYVENAVTSGDPEIYFADSYADFRGSPGVFSPRLELTTEPQVLYRVPEDSGVVSLWGAFGGGFPIAPANVVNFDDILHTLVVTVKTKEGVVFELDRRATLLAATVPGSQAQIQTLVDTLYGADVLPGGSELRVHIAESNNGAGPVYAWGLLNLFNQSDVRADQGGAY